MKTFLKVLLIVVAVIVAVKLLPIAFIAGCVAAGLLAALAVLGVSLAALLVCAALILFGTLTRSWFSASRGDASMGIGLMGNYFCDGGECKGEWFNTKTSGDADVPMAMMCDALCGGSSRRIIFVAPSPSRLGIWMSIRITSNS